MRAPIHPAANGFTRMSAMVPLRSAPAASRRKWLILFFVLHSHLLEPSIASKGSQVIGGNSGNPFRLPNL